MNGFRSSILDTRHAEICLKEGTVNGSKIKIRLTTARCLSYKRPLITDKQTNFV